MSITRKIFGTMLILILSFLLFSYSIIYTIFDNEIVKNVENYQDATATLTQTLIVNLIEMINHNTLMLSSDEEIGKCLSKDPMDSISMLKTRLRIQKKFSHFLRYQTSDDHIFSHNTLFLNDELKISNSFPVAYLSHTIKNGTNNVYSNSLVKSSLWYKKTMASRNKTHIFINKETNELCYSKKVQNKYYTGKQPADGIGVMVVRIPVEQLENVFSFTPMTAGSSFVLFDKNRKVLFKSSNFQSDWENDFLRYKMVANYKSTYNILNLHNEKYISIEKELPYGLGIIFITPYADLTAQTIDMALGYLAFASVFMVIASILAYIISKNTANPILNFSKSIDKIRDIRFFSVDNLNSNGVLEMDMLKNSIMALLFRANNTLNEIRKEDKKTTELDIKALYAQLNPILLSDVLSSIETLSKNRGDVKISKIVSSASNLIKYANFGFDTAVPLSLELKNINEYIKLHELVYGSSISIKIDREVSMDDVLIPKFILQPLVENSILHGSRDFNVPLEIQISIFFRENKTIIEVSDNGIGYDLSLLCKYTACDNIDVKLRNDLIIRNISEILQLKLKNRGGLSYFLKEDNKMIARLVIDNI